jgi:hypothetical protein
MLTFEDRARWLFLKGKATQLQVSVKSSIENAVAKKLRHAEPLLLAG